MDVRDGFMMGSTPAGVPWSEASGRPAAVKRDPSQWCTKHAPSKPGLCTVHRCHFYELHDEEIFEVFGVEAIFYCPELGCDDSDWYGGRDSERDMRWITTHLLKRRFPDLGGISGMRMMAEQEAVIREVFANAVRSKILFLKQRQMMEKLIKARVFEGGKKT